MIGNTTAVPGEDGFINGMNNVTTNGTGGCTTTGTTWSSSGSLVVANPEVDGLKAKVELLQAKIEELEKVENDWKDIEYFRRNLHKALKIPENYMSIPKVEISPDDILVLNVGVRGVSPAQTNRYLEGMKKGLAPRFDEAGLEGRVLFVPNCEQDSHTFSVLGITRGTETPTARVDEAEKRKFPPPIM